MALLEIEKLNVVYPNGTEALKSISLCAEAGEIVAIIGRSGAGKSTLLRCINYDNSLREIAKLLNLDLKELAK